MSYDKAGRIARERMEEAFPVGTRVKVDAYGEPITGTIVGYEVGYFHLKRDDGVEGGGPEGAWLTDYPGNYIFVYRLEEAKHHAPTNAHIMGLSPEAIDPTAYAAFMAGLEWGGL